MKIQTCSIIAAFLLCIAFVQDTEGAFGLLPSGKRELVRKVCIPGIKIKLIYKESDTSLSVSLWWQFFLILFSIKKSTNILRTRSLNFVVRSLLLLLAVFCLFSVLISFKRAYKTVYGFISFYSGVYILWKKKSSRKTSVQNISSKNFSVQHPASSG